MLVGVAVVALVLFDVSTLAVVSENHEKHAKI